MSGGLYVGAEKIFTRHHLVELAGNRGWGSFSWHVFGFRNILLSFSCGWRKLYRVSWHMSCSAFCLLLLKEVGKISSISTQGFNSVCGKSHRRECESELIKLLLTQQAFSFSQEAAALWSILQKSYSSSLQSALECQGGSHAGMKGASCLVRERPGRSVHSAVLLCFNW